MKLTTCCTVLTLALCGCGGGPSHHMSEKYYLVCPDAKIAYWQEAGAGFIKAAQEMKVQAEVVAPENYEAAAESQEFKRVAGKKPAGILVSAANADVLKPEIDAAVEAGIPVLTIDSDAPQSKRMFFVGTNNYEAGQMGGNFLAKLLGGKGTVVFFTIAGQKNLEERLDGYQAALAASPGIKVAKVIDMKGDARLAFDATTEMVEKKTPVDAFVSLESLSGSEIADVLDRSKVEGKVIVAMDAAANTRLWIEKGRIAATIMQKPFTMGYFGLKAVAEIALEKPESLGKNYGADPRSPYPFFIDTGTLLVDKNNIATVKK